MFDKYNHWQTAEGKERNMRILKKCGWELISPYTKASEYHTFLHPCGKEIIYQMCYVAYQLNNNPKWTPREIGDDFKKKIAHSHFVKGEAKTRKTLAEYGWELLEPYKGQKHKHKVKAPDGNVYNLTLHMMLHNLRLNRCYTPRKNSMVGNATQDVTAKPTPVKPKATAIVVNTDKQVTRQCVRCSNHYQANILDTGRVCLKCRKFKYG